MFVKATDAKLINVLRAEEIQIEAGCRKDQKPWRVTALQSCGVYADLAECDTRAEAEAYLSQLWDDLKALGLTLREWPDERVSLAEAAG